MKRGLLTLTLLLSARSALAQSFPDDAAWVPLPCRGGPMSDPLRDEAGAIDERDIVGDAAAPAGYRAADVEFFYLRLRLDADPAPAGRLRPFTWGIELDTDGVLSTYEVLFVTSGDAVSVFRNSTTTLPDDPTDPADEPAIATHPFTTHGRSVAAASSFGGGADFFLDIAIPWSELEPLGLAPATQVVAWASSSSTATSLNGDFACHDGTTGEPTLTGTAPEPTVLDPLIDSDSDGWPDVVEIDAGTDPTDPASHPAGEPPRLSYFEGGPGGCAVGGRAGGGWLLVGLALFLRRRR